MAALFGLPEAQKEFNGVSSHCRKCHRAATQDWRDRNRDETNAARRQAYGTAKPHRYPGREPRRGQLRDSLARKVRRKSHSAITGPRRDAAAPWAFGAWPRLVLATRVWRAKVMAIISVRPQNLGKRLRMNNASQGDERGDSPSDLRAWLRGERFRLRMQCARLPRADPNDR
jgi:hypothetical protein